MVIMDVQLETYAFSVKSGKLKPTDLNTTYLSGCEKSNHKGWR
jgi:hypothetical protein